MSEPHISVIFTPLFTQFLKHIAKKYRSVQKDVQPLIDQLEGGATPGDQVQGTQHPVYKVRVKNSDVPKGKSGGYRVIYYVKTANRIILIAIYAKTEQVDLPSKVIRRMIQEYEDTLKS
jgi:mRNA-degrading endonuclease RelE of RelBE toxin-antitoxin system